METPVEHSESDDKLPNQLIGQRSGRRLRIGVVPLVAAAIVLLAGGTALAVKIDAVLPQFAPSGNATSATAKSISSTTSTLLPSTGATDRPRESAPSTFPPGPGTTLPLPPPTPPKAPYTVPNFVKSTFSTAIAQLRSDAEKFTFTPGWANNCSGSGLYVSSQRPAPGTVVADVSTHVVIECTQQPMMLPDLVGMTPDTAMSALSGRVYNMRWDATCMEGGDQLHPNYKSKIVRQMPEPGTIIFPSVDSLTIYCTPES